jgi:pyruvate-formate lyase-activating enzyme
MKLEDIGFYSLSDKRALGSSENTRLERCELVLTKKCNFKCVYCRQVGPEDTPRAEAFSVVQYWKDQKCRNMRFSGGEPTLWPHLVDLVKFARESSLTEHVAISTNGSASIELYDELLSAGVNDFSISLDACCAATVGKMSGGTGIVEHIMNVIRHLAPKTYVTVGTVILPTNVKQVEEVVNFSYSVDAADVRLISAAQWNGCLTFDIPQYILDEMPILRYRVVNMNNGRNVRGMGSTDCNRCHLAIDDMVVSDLHHYPCIIYMREGGSPIGSISQDVRQERAYWSRSHNTYNDLICRQNCLDVCLDFNNKAATK